jgi:hypothetical protein
VAKRHPRTYLLLRRHLVQAPPSNPLTGLRDRIAAHWQQHRPKMYRDLQRSGKLGEAVNAATRLTKTAYHDLTERNVPSDQAWEAVRENWALLPSEKDVPELGTSPEEMIAEAETTASESPTE